MFAARPPQMGYRGPTTYTSFTNVYYESWATAPAASNPNFTSATQGVPRGTVSFLYTVNGRNGMYCKGAICDALLDNYSADYCYIQVPIATMPGGVDAGANFLQGVILNGTRISMVPGYSIVDATNRIFSPAYSMGMNQNGAANTIEFY